MAAPRIPPRNRRSKHNSDPTADKRTREFLQSYSGKSPNTVSTYNCALTSYLKWKGNSEISRESYDQFIENMRRRGREDNGIALYATVLRCYAEFRGMTIVKWQVPRTRKTPTDSLSAHELGMMQSAAARSRDSSGSTFLVTFLSQTGLRLGEFLALRWTDVDLVRRVVVVREGKGGDSREVPLTQMGWDSTMLYAKHRIASDVTPEQVRITPDYVWPGRDPPTLRKRILALARSAGLEARQIHTHTFRHTFATLSRQAGINEKWLQRLMGHKSLATTDRYGTVDMDAAFEKMQSISLGSAPRPAAA